MKTPLQYSANNDLVIVVGREKFIWDHPAEEYILTGDYNDDGYTLLYDNDESNDPATIPQFHNIAALSLTKYTSVPLIDFEAARAGTYENISINIRAYVVSNVIHFLAERSFNTTIAWEHLAKCILTLNWVGELFVSLAARTFCPDCIQKMYQSGAASKVSRSFSCDEIVSSLEGMGTCLDRMEKIKRAAGVFKSWSWACCTLVGLTLILSVLANYTSDLTPMGFMLRYIRPLRLALGSITMSVMLFAAFIFCRWLSPDHNPEV